MLPTTIAASAASARLKTPGGVQQPAEKAARAISWAEFERRYLHREDGYKYEWVAGVVEKSPRTVDQSQYYILHNLRRWFDRLRQSGPPPGGLEAEIDSFFLADVHRRPDVSYFSPQQEREMALGRRVVPEFVIGIISTTDQINLVHQKMRNYRDAGVRVVWQIFPLLEEVHVYAGQQLSEMVVRRDVQVCSAAPVLPLFELPAAAVFERPE